MLGEAALDPVVIEYARRFTLLNVNVAHGRASPHKVCMLLAVLDLARAGALPLNRITYDAPLLERYNRYFNAVKAPGDHPNAYFPFFHLSGVLRGGEASFWHLHAAPGHEYQLSALRSARSTRDLAHVEFASLDPGLFEALAVESHINFLGDALATHWFRRGLEELGTIASEERETSHYERGLRGLAPVPRPPELISPSRSAAFRRVVLDAYDYRCAATGERVVVEGVAMVQAAHLRPFSDTADDDPCNGMALTPDMHWALDNFLIAPGPDLKWHVHQALDDRIPDFRRLLSLGGRPVLPPRERRFTPRQDVLAWRLERLGARLKG